MGQEKALGKEHLWPHWVADHEHLKDHRMHDAKVSFLMSYSVLPTMGLAAMTP